MLIGDSDVVVGFVVVVVGVVADDLHAATAFLKAFCSSNLALPLTISALMASHSEC